MNRKAKAGLALVYCVVLASLLAVVWGARADAVETWCGVVVAPAQECPDYDAREWSYPADLDVRYGLHTEGGGWFSPYDGREYASYRDLDIEHVRSRHSAARGGGCDWPAAHKRAYAVDPLNLTVAPERLNRNVKRDLDPDRWMPAESQGWFAWRYLAVSRRFGLTITPETRDALAAVVGRRCP